MATYRAGITPQGKAKTKVVAVLGWPDAYHDELPLESSVVAAFDGVPVPDAVEVWLTHSDHPGLRFGVMVTRDGVPVSFEVAAWDDPARSGDIAASLALRGIGEQTQAHEAMRRRMPPSPRPVGTRTFRQVPIGDIQEAARTAVRDRATKEAGETRLQGEAGSVRHQHARREKARMAAQVETASPGRPRVFDDRQYAAWASQYVDEVANGARGVHRRLAIAWGVSESTSRNRVDTARNTHKLLTKAAARGRAGGELTARARQLLEGV